MSGPLLDHRYRLLRLLAQGGMGEVWEAIHLPLGRPVAIKRLRANLRQDSDSLQAFAREARFLALLKSRHVVEVLDFAVHDCTPFLVMELLEGEPLSSVLERHGTLSPSACAFVLSQVAEALEVAHSRAIAHCDLKPENVFVTPGEGEPLVKLIDFGIAQHAPSFGSQGTRATKLMGTPAYMAPELLEFRGASVPQSDVWSLGALAFECLLGWPAFPAVEASDRLGRLEPPKLPSEIVARVPDGFPRWFDRACHRDPSNRFSSARECLHAFSNN